MSRSRALVAIFGSILCLAGSVMAESYASPERQETALGHYSRARTLLLEAVKEFEMGRKIARPDLLVDPEEWRISVISRTEELNRILDPKPRITRQGVRFSAEKLLIQPEKQRRNLPPSMSPRDSNSYGEQQRMNEMKAAALMEKIRRESRVVEDLQQGRQAPESEQYKTEPLRPVVPPAAVIRQPEVVKESATVSAPVVTPGDEKLQPLPIVDDKIVDEPAVVESQAGQVEEDFEIEEEYQDEEGKAPEVDLDLGELDIYVDPDGEAKVSTEDDEVSIDRAKDVEVKVGDAIDAHIAEDGDTEVEIQDEDSHVEVKSGEDSKVVSVKDDAGMFDDFFRD
ncbi:MAG: hypothetical protein PHC51_11055 [bacterium]|nr:hypothetical protein [bacterium]